MLFEDCSFADLLKKVKYSIQHANDMDFEEKQELYEFLNVLDQKD